MSKFYYVTLSDVFQIEKLLNDRDDRKALVLGRSNGFVDVCRYSPRFNTAVFVSVPEDDERLAGCHLVDLH